MEINCIPDTDFVDLGNMKANNGNQNYDISLGPDISKYNTVLIWWSIFCFIWEYRFTNINQIFNPKRLYLVNVSLFDFVQKSNSNKMIYSILD
jgi:hypothetical protein